MAVGLAAVCAFVVFSYNSPASRHDRVRSYLPPTPGWLIAVECGFIFLPFLGAVILLRQKRNDGWATAGAGIAAGLFGSCLLLSPFAFLSMFLFLGLSANPINGRLDPGLTLAALALIILVISSAWIVWCAIAAGRNNAAIFTAAIVATVIYLGLGGSQVRGTEYRVSQQRQRAGETRNSGSAQSFFTAQRFLAHLAGCLIEYRAAHSDAGFPAALTDLPPDLHLPDGSGCDAWISRGAITGYTFTYTPQKNSTGAYDDFRLIAMPLQKGTPHLDPLAVDRRGRIFAYVGWAVTDRQPDFIPRLMAIPDDLGDSQILSLRFGVRNFAQKNDGHRPPALANLNWVPGQAVADLNTRRVGPYEVSYLPEARSEKDYTLTAVCHSYAVECLRSFLVDANGETHQTAEPRAATAADGLIPDCEKFAQSCADFDWPLPQ